MMIASVFSLMRQAGLTDDAPREDTQALEEKGAAAQEHIERLLGYKIEERFPPDEAPWPLHEAILQLACWWFENREAASDRDKPLPFGVAEIVAEYREWTF